MTDGEIERVIINLKEGKALTEDLKDLLISHLESLKYSIIFKRKKGF